LRWRADQHQPWTVIRQWVAGTRFRRIGGGSARPPDIGWRTNAGCPTRDVPGDRSGAYITSLTQGAPADSLCNQRAATPTTPKATGATGIRPTGGSPRGPRRAPDRLRRAPRRAFPLGRVTGSRQGQKGQLGTSVPPSQACRAQAPRNRVIPPVATTHQPAR